MSGSRLSSHRRAGKRSISLVEMFQFLRIAHDINCPDPVPIELEGHGLDDLPVDECKNADGVIHSGDP